jgi:hypothetical protein
MTKCFRKVTHGAIVLFGSAVLSAAVPHPASADCPLTLPANADIGQTLGLADRCRDAGSYRAEEYYRHAVEIAPDNPWALEALARYFRVYRGSRGLFATSEWYYLLAEAAVERLLAQARLEHEAPPRELLDIREQIIRGRIELNKPEGLGLLIPRDPGEKLGVYLATQFDYGRDSVPHKYLATDALKTFNRIKMWGYSDTSFDPKGLLRTPERFGLRTRLRLRYGTLPYLDIGWLHAHVTDALAEIVPPDDETGPSYDMWDLTYRDFQFAIEDVIGLAPAGDVLWRLEYHRVRVKEDNYSGEGEEGDIFDRIETADRLVAMTTLTRGFGRIKANLELLGSHAWVDRWWGAKDTEYTVGAGLWVLRFPDLATTERWPIDPRAQEYRIGVVRETQYFNGADDHDGDGVLREKNVSTTVYAALKLTELVPRTDVQLFLNWFELDTLGRPWDGVREQGGNVEINLIVTHRIIDWVNDLRVRQVDKLAGLALWTASLRLFDEESTHALDDFENWGGALASSVEFFSGPANRSTAILEASYELRNYHRLDDVQHLFRVGVRFGF